MISHLTTRLRRLRLRVPDSAAEAGYNIVVLAVAITLLNILIAKALPLWSHQIQREKEEELIFRGLQYAEAIRVFQVRNQRLPTKLEELIKIKPRAIRKLWKNPMNEEGDWGLIFQDQPTAPGQQNQNPGGRAGRGRQRGNEEERESRFGLPRDGEQVRIGPITGVYSKDGDDAIKIFAPLGGGGAGGGSVTDWRFTVDLLQGLGQRGVGTTDGTVQIPTMNASDIGKPWPPGIQLPRFQGGRSPGQDRRGGRDVTQPERGSGGRGSGSSRQPGRGNR